MHVVRDKSDFLLRLGRGLSAWVAVMIGPAFGLQGNENGRATGMLQRNKKMNSNITLSLANARLLGFWWAWMAILVCSAEAQPGNQMRYARDLKTEVRCGPGASYYVTTELKQGAAVEVYHRTKDGWCGIRPPEGSACWVAAEQAYLLPGGKTAEIVGAKAPAWIASQDDSLSQLRWQIELQPSQQVQVLGEATQAIDDQTQRLWYRIAPPPGEFRWVHEKHLSKEPLIASPNDAPLQVVDGATGRKVSVPSAATAGPASGKVQLASTQSRAVPTTAKGVEREGKGIRDSEVTTAQYQEGARIVSQHTEPYQLADGEQLVGEEVVVSDQVVGGDSEGMVEEYEGGEMIVDEGSVGTMEGESVSWTGASHDSSVSDRLLVRPLNGILGFLGFGIAEADVVNEPIGPGVLGGSSMMDRSISARLEQLPRPMRRIRGLQSPLMNSPSVDWGMSGPYSSTYPVGTGLGSGVGSGVAGSGISGAGMTGTMADRLPSPSQRYAQSSSILVPSETPPTLGVGSSAADWHAAGDRSGRVSGSVGEAVRGVSNSGTVGSSGVPASTISYQRGSSLGLGSGTLQLTTPQLRETFFELTRVVSQPMEQWDLRGVHHIASEWVEKGPSTLERGEARLLLDRIQEFEALRQKWVFGGLSNSSASLATYQQSVGTSEPEMSASAAQQADASGVLSQVHTSRPGQPEFALTDEQGNVIAYVTASPGMNLRRYVKQPIAIYGTKGYLPELASRQIIADRVVRLR